jgi:hypothetical protein
MVRLEAEGAGDFMHEAPVDVDLASSGKLILVFCPCSCIIYISFFTPQKRGVWVTGGYRWLPLLTDSILAGFTYFAIPEANPGSEMPENRPTVFPRRKDCERKDSKPVPQPVAAIGFLMISQFENVSGIRFICF